MKRLLNFIALGGVLTVAACATPPRELTRDEYLAMTTRSYKGVSQKKLMDTAEQVLRLADSSDFKLHHKKNGFLATRQFVGFYVIAAVNGTDYWDIDVSGSQMTLAVSQAASGMSAWATPDGGAVPVTIAGQGQPIQGDALYRLFWARMDYLLGKSKDEWPTCAWMTQQIRDGHAWGDLSPLCGQDVKDLSPEKKY